MMKTDEHIEPCPFCGSDDIDVMDNSDLTTGEQDWIICCTNCGSAFIASNDAMPVTRRELINRWNRRTHVGCAYKSGVWYWPMAITENGEKLFTYNSVHSIRRALQQFSIWQDNYGYKIRTALIEATDGKIIHVEHQWVVTEVEDGSDVER